jgi:hypothetical protein
MCTQCDLANDNHPTCDFCGDDLAPNNYQNAYGFITCLKCLPRSLLKYINYNQDQDIKVMEFVVTHNHIPALTRELINMVHTKYFKTHKKILKKPTKHEKKYKINGEYVLEKTTDNRNFDKLLEKQNGST